VSTRGPQAAPARTKASDRVARMLAMIPWIASHDGPTVDEICERFQVDRRKLLDDLEVLSLVGVPPYTPDTLIEVTIEGDRVWLRFAEVFARPLHLTPEQGGQPGHVLRHPAELEFFELRRLTPVVLHPLVEHVRTQLTLDELEGAGTDHFLAV